MFFNSLVRVYLLIYFTVPPSPYLTITKNGVLQTVFHEGEFMKVECATPLADPSELTLSIYNGTKQMTCNPVSSGMCLKCHGIF